MPSIKHFLAAARQTKNLHRKNSPCDIVLLMRSGPRLHHRGYVIEAAADMMRACDVTGNLDLPIAFDPILTKDSLCLRNATPGPGK